MPRQAEGCRKYFGGARLPAAHSRCLQLYARPGKALGQLGGHLLFLHACRSAAGQADASLRQLSWSRSASHPQTPCPALQSCGAAGTCPGRPAGSWHSRIGMDRRACGGMQAEMRGPSTTCSSNVPPPVSGALAAHTGRHASAACERTPVLLAPPCPRCPLSSARPCWEVRGLGGPSLLSRGLPWKRCPPPLPAWRPWSPWAPCAKVR